MGTKTGKMFGRIFSFLAIISFLVAGCAKAPQKASGPTAKEPEAAQAASPAAPSPPPQPREQVAPRPPAEEPPPPAAATPAPKEQPAAETSPDPIASGSILLNPLISQDAKTIQSRLSDLGFYKGTIDGLWGKGSKTALKRFKEKNSLKNPDSWDKGTQMALFAKTGQAGQSAAETSQDPIASGSVLLNPSIPQDAKTIQSRLAERGFYKGTVDGLWGKSSKAALKAFKDKNSLKNPNVWDKETQIMLFKGMGK